MTGEIALTGGTGFIGGRLIERLTAAGHRVRALARRPSALAARPGLEIVEGELFDDQALRRLCAGVGGVVHCAGLTRARRAADFARINAEGTRRLAAAAAANAPDAPFVLLSSLAARAPALSPYAASKRAAEDALAEVVPRLRWVALRPPAVYGPGDRATLPILRQLARPLALVPGRSEQRFSLIHVDDLADAVVALLGVAGRLEGQVLELHDGRAGGYGWADLAACCAAAGPARVIHLPRPLLAGAAGIATALARVTGGAPQLSPGKVAELYHPDWVCRDNPVTELCGWRPRIQIDRGFPATLAWYKDRDWW